MHIADPIRLCLFRFLTFVLKTRSPVLPKRDHARLRWIKLRLSTRAIRTIDKIGLKAYAKRAGVKI